MSSAFFTLESRNDSELTVCGEASLATSPKEERHARERKKGQDQTRREKEGEAFDKGKAKAEERESRQAQVSE